MNKQKAKLKIILCIAICNILLIALFCSCTNISIINNNGNNVAGNEANTNQADTGNTNTVPGNENTVTPDNTSNSSENTVPVPPDNTANNTTNTDPGLKEKTWAERTLEGMSLDEKIGQLFIIRPDQLQTSWDAWTQHSEDVGVTSFTDEMKTNLEDYPVGGFIIFDKNLVDPDQTKDLIADMNEYLRIKPFIAVDEEGGRIARIANSGKKGFKVTLLPSMGWIGESGNVDTAEYAGSTIGQYLKEYGFNLDFAPVADLDDIKSKGVIGDRSFGTDPETTSKMIGAFLKGLHSQGVLSCMKHFPGQGSAEIDTHAAYSDILKNWSEMLQTDIVPFKENIDAADMIMLSHISYPIVTGNPLPTSLSKELITDKLRNELGFKGVIITDSFHMGAIINSYSPEDAAIKAIKAGADIILMSDDFIKAFNALKNAVKTGVISEQRINESVLRILTLKEKLND